MNKDLSLHIKEKLLPLLVFPFVVGALTGVVIFAFKLASSLVIERSERIYAFVRENPKYLPGLVLGVIIVGVMSALLLKYFKECRGGGIPTAVASIRGLIPMKWAQGVFALFGSALLTYTAGVPLGNEGPSVQIGAAVGKGASGLFGKKNRAWERYNMTGGACSGFAIATGAPLSGIIFAMEEAHRRFSPTIFIVAATSVISGTVTADILSFVFKVDTTFFDFTIDKLLPFKYLWVAAIIGILCGISANLLTKLYHYIRNVAKTSKVKIPFSANIVIIFAITAVLGFISADFVGSGHSLIEKIIEGHAVWYVILIAFIIRAVLMILANSGGVSGGLFVPTLAFGAMISSVLTDGLIAVGLVDSQYYVIFIVVGMASFLSSSSRIPLTALAFSAEALCGATNILPVVVGVATSYFVAEIMGRLSFADTVIEAKTAKEHANKTPVVVDSHMRVQPGAFVIGMEIRDILWPPTCAILSIHRAEEHHTHHAEALFEGDLIHLHYQTYDTAETLELLTRILGEQPEDDQAKIHGGRDGHIVPNG